MSVEIYDNYKVQKAEHIDAKLVSAASVANLPDPTVAGNFLYLGALAYVINENAHYRVELVAAVWTWVYFAGAGNNLITGYMNITPSTTTLDLSLVTSDAAGLVPVPVSTCYTIKVIITSTGGGTTGATIGAITNFPSGADRLLSFTTEVNNVLTFTHTGYASAIATQVVIEDGFDMSLTGRLIGNECLTLKDHSGALCQHTSVQFVAASEWLNTIASALVYNGLDSTDGTIALSAHQGNILNQLLDTKQQQLVAGDNITLTAGATTTLIKADPWAWVQTTYDSTVANLSTALVWLGTNPFGATAVNYFRVIARNDAGAPTFLLPPGLAPDILGNWVLISEATVRTQHTKFGLNAQNLGSSPVLTAQHFVEMGVSNYVGDYFPTSINTGSNNLNAVSVFFADGLYKVDMTLVVFTTNLSVFNDIAATLYLVSSDATNINPLGTAAVMPISSDHGTYDANATAGQQTFHLTGTFEVGNTAYSGFAAAFNTLGGAASLSDFDMLSSVSSIQVTKIR
jgi:hypothetical protein